MGLNSLYSAKNKISAGKSGYIIFNGVIFQWGHELLNKTNFIENSSSSYLAYLSATLQYNKFFVGVCGNYEYHAFRKGLSAMVDTFDLVSNKLVIRISNEFYETFSSENKAGFSYICITKA